MTRPTADAPFWIGRCELVTLYNQGALLGAHCANKISKVSIHAVFKLFYECHPLRQYAQGFVAINLAANLFCFWRRYGQVAPRPTLAWLPCETAMFGAWPVDSRALRLQSQVGTQTTAKHDHI